MLKSFRSTYIDYLAHLKNGDRELRADTLSAIQRDCDARLERWDRFLQIDVDFAFSEYDLEKFIDLDRNLLKAIDLDEGIHETIANAIEVLEEMLGWEIRQKRFSQGRKSFSKLHSKYSSFIIRFERSCRSIHE